VSRREEFYGTMRQDLDRLNATINNVLHAAMYHGRATAEPQSLDLARLTRRSIDLTRTRYQLPPDSFSYEGPESMSLTGDSGARAAVLNLSTTPSLARARAGGGGAGPRGDGLTRLRVRDHGIGMSRAHLRSSSTASTASAPRCCAAAPAPVWACSSCARW
jgi:signal transduction histidine kinase